MSDTFERAKAEADRAKGSIDEARRELGAAVDQVRGGPATDPQDAQRKLDELRARIDRDLTALRARVPDTEEVASQAKTAGIAAAGGVAALTTVIVLAKRRSAKRNRDEVVRTQAIALARELARLDLQEVAAEGDGQRRGGAGRWVALLGLLGAAAAVLVARVRAGQDLPEELWDPVEEEQPLTPVPPA